MSGAISRAWRLVHDDIDWVIYGPISVFPFAGPRKGRAAVLEAMGASRKNIAGKLQARDRAGGRRPCRGDVGRELPQRATGRTLRFRIANFLRFADGRVIEFREFANTFDVVEQVLGRELSL